MAASLTVSQLSPPLNSPLDIPRRLTPSRGIVTLYGYGISVRVNRGHLVVEDGIGPARRQARFARVRHGLRRLVVIGADGIVSLAALRWLADQKAAFVMLDRDGSVLLATGPTGPNDARLRRAQAVAHHSGVAIPIMRDLIDRKLAEQARIAGEIMGNAAAARAIAACRDGVSLADTAEAIRFIEAQAALAYWACWRALPVAFPTKDLPRVPEHWQTFGARRSPLTGSPRLSVNPPNAMLNFLYSILESEARLAATAFGLDPGLGLMHADTKARDSLACDLMEPVRPHVDAYVLHWLTCESLRREWFFEQRDGTCRLIGGFAERLAETGPTWARAIAPVAEQVAKVLWAGTTRSSRGAGPATLLTQSRRRAAKGAAVLPASAPPSAPRVCRVCGASRRQGHTYCKKCDAATAPSRMRRVAEQGRIAAQGPRAQAHRAATQRRNAQPQRAWKASDQPAWLTEQVYWDRIQPRLAELSASKVAAALRVSRPYAVNMRAGRRRPHPRHWRALAELAGVSPPGNGVSRTE